VKFVIFIIRGMPSGHEERREQYEYDRLCETSP
jgi:hypothetical protein